MFVVDTLILICGFLLVLGIASSKLSARMGIPTLVLFLSLGMLAGSDGLGGLAFEDYGLAHGIGTVALALILFDGGLGTQTSSIRQVWRPALSLATIGVFVTSVVTGLAAMWILKLTWLQGLLLGSIVGSTDAAAVFSVLRSGGVRLSDRLQSTLEVESGSNDPMAIFLTVGCIEIISGRMQFGPELLGLFATQMLIGVAIGYGMGKLSGWIVNHIDLDAQGLYPVLVTALCLLTFGVAAQLGGSGFLAVYLAGLLLGNQKIVFQRGIRVFHDALAWLAQIVMFVVLGLLSFPTRLWHVSGQALLIGLVLIFVARPLAVLCSLPWQREKYSLRELTFISWVGLKGAVPITLATFPLLQGAPQARLLFDVVFFIVVLSALVQGSSLPWMAGLLGLGGPPEPTPPLSLEISSLRHVDGEIVEYSVSADSRACGRKVKDLALPEGVVIALIARGEHVIPPQGRTCIEAGDHVIIVLRPGTRPLVNQVFAQTQETRGVIPPALEFPLRPSTTVAELAQFYDIVLAEDAALTLEQFLRSRLSSDELAQQLPLCCGPIALRVRQWSPQGDVEMIGLSLLPENSAT